MVKCWTSKMFYRRLLSACSRRCVDWSLLTHFRMTQMGKTSVRDRTFPTPPRMGPFPMILIFPYRQQHFPPPSHSYTGLTQKEGCGIWITICHPITISGGGQTLPVGRTNDSPNPSTTWGKPSPTTGFPAHSSLTNKQKVLFYTSRLTDVPVGQRGINNHRWWIEVIIPNEESGFWTQWSAVYIRIYIYTGKRCAIRYAAVILVGPLTRCLTQIFKKVWKL